MHFLGALKDHLSALWNPLCMIRQLENNFRENDANNVDDGGDDDGWYDAAADLHLSMTTR